MSNSAVPEVLVCAATICEPSGLINATLAPAPKAPKAGTTMILLTIGVGVGGVGVTGVTGVMGATGAGAEVLDEEPPPQPDSNAKGKTKNERNLCIFMVRNLNINFSLNDVKLFNLYLKSLVSG